MGFFNDYQREGKGVPKEQNTPRFLLFFQIYFRKFWNLLLLNMLYVVFCIPVVTIGPATAGLTKVLRNYAREEHAFLWGDFIEAFKKNFKQSLLYSLLDFVILGILILDLLSVGNVPNKILMTLSLAAILFSLTVYIFMRYYVYNMMVTFHLTLWQLLKNAFIFCWTGFFRNLFLTAILALITYFLGFYLNITLLIFVLFFLYFTFCGLLINFMINPMIKKYMIDGYDPKTGERLEEEKYEGFEEEYEPDELDQNDPS